MTPKLISLDIGYGYVKAHSMDKTTIFPSVSGVAEEIQYTGDLLGNKASAPGIHLLTPQGERCVGELALSQSRVHWSARDRRRTGSDDMLTLTLAALSELESAGPLRLVTGLPVKWYKQDKDALVEQLTGQHRIERAGRPAQSVTVAETLVTIQPFGSLFSVIYNEAGKIVNPEIARGRVGVIDIGMYTSDFIIYDRGRYIEPGSGSVTTAMSRVYELAGAKIERSFDHPVSLYETDRAIRQGYVSVRGRRRPLAELVDPILRGVSDEILAAVVNRWSGYESGLDTILVSGGGASAIGPYLSQRFPHLSILPDGATANVIGYYRYGLFKSKRQNRKNGNGR